MTKEEAIKILKEQQNEFNEHWIDYAGINEAYKIAIEALGQQKTGKWETTTTIFCGRTFEVIECSCCKTKQNWFAKTNYCPNCGTKMEVSE